MKSASTALFALAALASGVRAHMGPFVKGVYALNGTVKGVDNLNSADIVNPLYNLKFEDYWLHGLGNVNKFPPLADEFLEVPAGGQFTIEIAANRAVTTLAYDGNNTTPWGDGQQHPDNYSMTNLGGIKTSSACIPSPNMHTQNETKAAGTAMAISYESDISKVTPANTVVFSIAPNTPYRRIANYSVPALLPACPAGGCTCVWAWIPENCGEANIFMVPIKCNVTQVSAQALQLSLPAQNATWCENDQSTCVKGAKGIIINNQAEGNTVNATGVFADDGEPAAPGYNYKMGYYPGAQNDIFVNATAPAASSSTASGAQSSATANSKRMHRKMMRSFGMSV